ncbi:MAG TPA: sulfite exporter TauE/SafE family protein [Burkholderiaceae bacterium]|nr:sulfite exporter TauE/SafE family protein [Burkholderiaceae bacterium]
MAGWETYLAFVGCVAIANFVQNLTGFAFGLILLGLVSVFDLASVADAANAATVLTLVNAASYFRLHRLRPEWRIVRPAILPSLVGVGVGVAMLTWLSGNATQALRGLLGLAILACAFGLLVDSKPRATLSRPAAFAAVGAISGLMGGLFSSAGPPLVYHMYRQPAPREVIQQCLILMFAINQVLRLALVVGSGRFSLHSGWLCAAAVPAVYVVTWLQHRYMPPVGIVATRRVVSGLLIVAGGSLLVSVLGVIMS